MCPTACHFITIRLRTESAAVYAWKAVVYIYFVVYCTAVSLRPCYITTFLSEALYLLKTKAESYWEQAVQVRLLIALVWDVHEEFGADLWVIKNLFHQLRVVAIFNVHNSTSDYTLWLCTAIISSSLAVILNYKCIAGRAVDRTLKIKRFFKSPVDYYYYSELNCRW
jgi:hypothetical protein